MYKQYNNRKRKKYNKKSVKHILSEKSFKLKRNVLCVNLYFYLLFIYLYLYNLQQCFVQIQLMYSEESEAI